MKTYVVPEYILINLLEASMRDEMYERDGVDNWPSAGESYREIIEEYYPDNNGYLDELPTFRETAIARIEAGEFQELFTDFDI